MNAAPDMLPPLPPSPAPVAAPSFVLPGNIVENVRFLAGRVEEVALMESVVTGGRRQYRCLAIQSLENPTGERRSGYGQNGG